MSEGLRMVALIVALTLGQAVTPSVGVTQEIRKIPRVGILGPGWPPTAEQYARSPWLHALRNLGWVEGKTVAFEWRYADGQPDRLPSLAADLARIPVDVIVADTPPAVVAAGKATAKIPIVFLGVTDPVAQGLVQSLARPGGNVTGLSLVPGPEVRAKQLEFLKEIVPGARRVAWLVDANLAPAPARSVIEVAAGRLGFELRRFEVHRPQDFDAAFAAMLAWPAEALFIPGGIMFLPHRDKIIEFTLRHRLPTTFGMWQLALGGGLVSYYPSNEENARRWAAIIDKILRGTKPGDIPIEEPTTFELVINLKTAKALGLTIPRSLLQRADQVIE